MTYQEERDYVVNNIKKLLNKLETEYDPDNMKDFVEQIWKIAQGSFIRFVRLRAEELVK